MGLFDSFGDPSLTPEEKQAAKEAKAAEKQARKDAKEALKARIQFTQGIKFEVGKQLVGAKGMFGDKIYQLDDRHVVFDLDDPIFFRLIAVNFAGARYHEEITEEAKSDTKSKGKKKSHVLGGAVLGTMLMPGVGTIAGAIAGSGSGKSKGSSSTSSSGTTSTRQIEDDSQTTLVLEKVDDGERVEAILTTKTKEYQELRALKVEPKPEVSTDSADAGSDNTTIDDIREVQTNVVTPSEERPVADPIEEIRKFKGLLDDGIISQEEFDAKKKQLLGL